MSKYTIFNAILVACLIANLLTIKSAVLGLPALLLFIFFSSLIYSQWYRGRVIFGFLAFLFLIVILTSILYFVYELDALALIFIMVVLLFLPMLLLRTSNKFYSDTPVYNHTPVYRSEDKNDVPGNSLLSTLLVYILFGLGIFVLFKSATTESIVSPWAVAPRDFLIILFLIILALFYFKKTTTLSILPLFILSSSVALIVYKVGYGFDGFVHEAALRYIDKFGAITPKTPYYIGMYGLEIFLSKFSGLDVGVINRILLPLAFGFLTPLILVRDPISNKKTVLFLLLMPISSIVATTPQGLANLFLIILVIASCHSCPRLDSRCRENDRRVSFLLFLGTLAITSVHLLAGLPTLLFFALWLLTRKYSIKKMVVLTACMALVIPAAFLVLAKFYPALAQFGRTENSLITLFAPLFDLKTRYNFWLDLTYFAGWLSKAFLAGLMILGFRKLRQDKKLNATLPYLGLSAILLIDFAVLYKLFSFPLLIFYEQGDFALRFLEMSFYFLIPLILVGGSVFLERLTSQGRLIRITSLTVLAFLITSTIYLSYPRKDAYSVSHGFGTSIHDVAAIQAIAKDAGDDKYIVLANQAVGAAALREFGFFKPYLKANNNEFYFYSIPTGGELYKYYLKMVYGLPKAEYAHEAAEFTGVNTVYLVINDYWWNAKKLIAQAKIEATDWQEINQGKVFIFKFKK